MSMQHRITTTAPRSRRFRGSVIAAVAAVAVAASAHVPPAHAALPASGGGQPQEYIPFVTDFPKPGTQTAAAERFIPGVTDVPTTSVAPAAPAERPAAAAEPTATGTAGDDVAVGIAIATAFGALAASGLALRRRVRPVRS